MEDIRSAEAKEISLFKKNIFDLSGKVALVTAGGHGLGRAYCEAMAEFGADVACADINKALAEETVAIIKKFGHRAIAIEADVSKQDQIERMVNQTVAELGTVDILFCNAGTDHPLVRLHELPVESWDACINLNLRGTFLCMRAVLPVMLKQKKGSIISTASIAGITAGGWEWSVPNLYAYGASKAGIINLTKYTAVAYAKDGIRINAIAPGGHDTKSTFIPPEVIQPYIEKVAKFCPMGRVGRPEEIKGLAVWLASDASSYVTGQTFVQDGGFIA
jgi:NAD(P)-dependent dehydrogenase (short-subunit alcohol dehydrogenase family)